MVDRHPFGATPDGMSVELDTLAGVEAVERTLPPHRHGRTRAELDALVGQRSLKVTSDTYTHVLVDGRELDYVTLLELR